MVNSLLISAFVIFAVVGITDVIFGIKKHFLKPKNNLNYAIIIDLSDDNFEAEIEYFTFLNNWYGNKNFKFTVFITDALSEKSLTKCRMLVRKSGAILCKRNMLSSLFNGFADE